MQENRTVCRTVDGEQYLGILRELLEAGKEVSLTVTGGSMTPFLIHGRDDVFLVPAENPKRGDVVLYLRDNGMYVLHRIVKEETDGTYVLCGDAQTEVERNICREQILGTAAGIRRNGKIRKPGSFFWFFFAHVWIRLIPVRQKILKLYAFLKRSGSPYGGKDGN